MKTLTHRYKESFSRGNSNNNNPSGETSQGKNFIIREIKINDLKFDSCFLTYEDKYVLKNEILPYPSIPFMLEPRENGITVPIRIFPNDKFEFVNAQHHDLALHLFKERWEILSGQHISVILARALQEMKSNSNDIDDDFEPTQWDYYFPYATYGELEGILNIYVGKDRILPILTIGDLWELTKGIKGTSKKEIMVCQHCLSLFCGGWQYDLGKIYRHRYLYICKECNKKMKNLFKDDKGREGYKTQPKIIYTPMESNRRRH